MSALRKAHELFVCTKTVLPFVRPMIAGSWRRCATARVSCDDRRLPQARMGVVPPEAARATWHSAQHCRQLVAVLERMGIQPDRPLTKADLAGLPLPERDTGESFEAASRTRAYSFGPVSQLNVKTLRE